MPTQGPSPSSPQGQRATGWCSMPFSLETLTWAVSALFQLLAVCAYLLSFPHVDGVCDQLPDIDGVDDQLPDMPEVIQDSAIEKKITYSGIIFVFGFYTQGVVVKQSWNWWRKKMEEPDNSLMVMVGVYVHNLICNFFQVSHASMVLSSNLGTWLRKASCTTCGPPFFLASVFLVGICIVAGLSFFSDTWTSFLVLREKVRARMKEQEDATTETATNSETVTPADASPADAPPVAESKAPEPTVGADSSGGVKEAKGLADFARVALDREPKNFPEQFRLVEAWAKAGENGAVPAVARVELLGDVRVNGKESVGESEVRAAVEDEIAETARNPITRPWYNTWLSEMGDEPGAEWMADLADALEKGDIETVGELAAVDINDRGIPLAVTHASQLIGARKTLWGWKRAAADFLGVKIPKEVPRLPSKPSKELPREHQHVLDTIDRWVKHVSKEATFAVDYVNALVVIARRRKA